MEDDFLGTGLDIVHGTYPGHHVFSFEILGNAFGFLYLADDQIQALCGLLVDVGQTVVSLAGDEQSVKSDRVLFLQISAVESAPAAYGTGFFLHFQSRDIVVPNLYIFHKWCLLFAVYLQYSRTKAPKRMCEPFEMAIFVKKSKGKNRIFE